MTLSIALGATYFVINFAIMIWLAREETHGRAISSTLISLSRILRYGPPLVGLLYLVTIAGDWPFVLFVGAFFAGAFWLLDSLLNYPPPPSPKR
jgi:ABC-type molybdate transport system permease subunit